jgi:hypothetical protein
MVENPHALPITDIETRLISSFTTGLDMTEARERLKNSGANQVPEHRAIDKDELKSIADYG